MSTFLPCPYLEGDVELTEERQQHIETDHGEVLPAFATKFAATIREPDVVLRRRDGERAFVRAWPKFTTASGSSSSS